MKFKKFDLFSLFRKWVLAATPYLTKDTFNEICLRRKVFNNYLFWSKLFISLAKHSSKYIKN